MLETPEKHQNWLKTITFTDLSPSRLGRITLISTIENGLGVLPHRPFRVYPSYALVLITRGYGMYRDESGLDLPVTAGDAILVFPGVAHTYGPAAGTRWDEHFAIFDGPAFDAWRAMGVLNPSDPVVRPPASVDIGSRLRHIALAGLPPEAPYSKDEDLASTTRRSLQVCALLMLLCEICPAKPAPKTSAPTAWATRACSLLARTGPNEPTLEEIARAMGSSLVTFRRRFNAEVGAAPALWRARRRMEAACHLMQYSDLTFARIAEQIGYADEYHFSKRFKQLVGVSPSQFRRQVRDGDKGSSGD